MRTGFSASKTVNGETVPDYTAEKTANTSTLGKMHNRLVSFLTSNKIKGTGGVVGTYDDTIIGEACHKIFNGAHAVDVYGSTIPSQIFERFGLI